MAAGVANAAVTGVTWRVVDNTVGNPGGDSFAGAVWNSLNQYTFDLILQGDAGQRINGINMGDSNAPAATPYFISTNGTVFNHALGSNVRSAAFEPAFSALQYDTFVALGSTVPGPGISFAGGQNLNGPTLRATWFTTDNAVLDANGEMRIMRVTVGYANGFNPYTQGGFLGTLGVIGQTGVDASTIEIGLPGGALQTLTVGNAFEVPAPAATALMGLAGLAGLRRRR
ncbi:MAG: hypothetical protein IBJ10_09590 [Phycisphaerales bacterium]|nr:hypothetical protein [Phycisphaerales bacterium]